MEVGDLVEINAGSPYFGRVGVIARVEDTHGTIFYDVIIFGESSLLRFRDYVMENISESRWSSKAQLDNFCISSQSKNARLWSQHSWSDNWRRICDRSKRIHTVLGTICWGEETKKMHTEKFGSSRIESCAGSSVGDERQSYKLEVVGSNPTRRTYIKGEWWIIIQKKWCSLLKVITGGHQKISLEN